MENLILLAAVGLPFFAIVLHRHVLPAIGDLLEYLMAERNQKPVHALQLECSCESLRRIYRERPLIEKQALLNFTHSQPGGRRISQRILWSSGAPVTLRLQSAWLLFRDGDHSMELAVDDIIDGFFKTHLSAESAEK